MNPPILFLLVDDDATCNFLTSSIITDSGLCHSPLGFNDPMDMVRYSKQNCLSGKKPYPDLILIDIHMPCLSGFELVEELRLMEANLLDKTLLCFLSSSSVSRDQIQARQLGIACSFEKPLSTTHVDTLRSTLKTRS